jgi:PemK-like, MazF-like toxin of type II toxin-antitoxin system
LLRRFKPHRRFGNQQAPPCLDRQQRRQQPGSWHGHRSAHHSNVTKVYPFEVALSRKESGLPKDSKAQAQQIRIISKERIAGPALGRLRPEKMRAVDVAIRLQLAL